MSQKVSGTPESVADLVALQNYVIECRDVTMYNLKDQIRKTAENVNFLMEHAHLTGTLQTTTKLVEKKIKRMKNLALMSYKM